MQPTRRQFVLATAAGLMLPDHLYSQANPTTTQQPNDRELTGKTICGYQGWFNAEGDGHELGFRHYAGVGGRFEPGHCTIDYWPDMSELDADERFDTPFRHKDGSVAQVYSAANAKTIGRHFDWMQTYGIDGVAIQRFGTSLRNPKIRDHHDAVIDQARVAAARTGRHWMTMYDLSGMRRGEPQERIADDWRGLVDQRGVTDEPAYLQHQGKPIVALWGIGFSDGRRAYTLSDCSELIDRVSMGGRFSVMLGTPYYWREQKRDAVDDPGLHDLLGKADILSPWAVGRFKSTIEASQRSESMIRSDLEWCRNAGKHYLPVIFPGFSWHNLKKEQDQKAELNQIPRQGGRFLWVQAEAARSAGAKSLYVAMFDEMDEGTAIFKCTNDPPDGDSPLLTYEDLPSDHYLWLTGKIAQRMRQVKGPAVEEIPRRKPS